MNLLGIINAVGKSFKAKLALMLIVARVVVNSSKLQALHWSKACFYALIGVSGDFGWEDSF